MSETPAEMLVRARLAAGLTQEELARRAGTSRPTLSAYEHERKLPTAGTFSRLLAAVGHELAVVAVPRVVEHVTSRGCTVCTLSELPRLPADRALSTVTLPIHLNWSALGRRFNVASRSERARVYEIVLREGGPEDVITYVDGVLLIDLWDELVLPCDVRAAWSSVVRHAAQGLAL